MTASPEGLLANAYECMNSIRMSMDQMLFNLDSALIAIEDGVQFAQEGDLDRFWAGVEIAFQRMDLHVGYYRTAVELAETLSEVNRYGGFDIELGDVVLWDPFPVVELYETVLAAAMSSEEHVEALRGRAPQRDPHDLTVYQSDLKTVDDKFVQAVARAGGIIRRMAYVTYDVDAARARTEAYL